MQINLPSFIFITELPDQDFKRIWDNLVGVDELKERIVNYMLICLDQSLLKSWFDKFYESDFSQVCKFFEDGKILLIGPSGTGKTSLAKACSNELAQRLNSKVYFVEFGILRSKFVGVTSKNIRNAFSAIRNLAEEFPTIVFIDELDSIASPRNYEQMNEDVKAGVNTLIKEMDGIKSKDGIILISASNFEDFIDVAVRRRFDLEIKTSKPNLEQRIILLKHFLKPFLNKGISEKDVVDLVKKLKGYTHDDLKRGVKEAIFRSVLKNSMVEKETLLSSLKEIFPTPSYEVRI